jgi:ankyrin repeat protein
LSLSVTPNTGSGSVLNINSLSAEQLQEKNTLLRHFLALDNLDEVERLVLKEGVDVNTECLYCNSNGDRQNPLLLAYRKGEPGSMKAFIKKGADIHYRFGPDHAGYLNLVLEKEGWGYGEVARLLMARGANLDIEVGGKSSLYRAIEHNHEEVARDLIEKDVFLGARDDSPYNPIHCAAREGMESLATLLIERAMILRNNSSIVSRKHPLSYAVYFGDKELVNIILEGERGIFSRSKFPSEKSTFLKPLLIWLCDHDDHEIFGMKTKLIFTEIVKRSFESSQEDFPLTVLKTVTENCLPADFEGIKRHRVLICSYLIAMILPKTTSQETVRFLVEKLIQDINFEDDDQYRTVFNTLNLLNSEAYRTHRLRENLEQLIDPLSVEEKAQKSASVDKTLLEEPSKLTLKAFLLFHGVISFKRSKATSCGKVCRQSSNDLRYTSVSTINRGSFINGLRSHLCSILNLDTNFEITRGMLENFDSIMDQNEHHRKIERIFMCANVLFNDSHFKDCKDKQIYKKLFHIYITDVLDPGNSFIERKYDLERSPHLKAIFGRDESGKELLERWRQNEVTSAADLEASVGHPDRYTIISTDDPLYISPIDDLTPSVGLVLNTGRKFFPHYPASLLDGKYRQIVVENGLGITAKCFLIILLDNKTDKPVLFQDNIRFMERENPLTMSDCSALINKMSERIAQKMNLPLVKRESHESTSFHRNCIRALSGRCAFEYQPKYDRDYDDAYEIVGVTKIWEPPS